MLASLPSAEHFPQSTNVDGSLGTMKSDWWCSGFFAGSLWYLYEATEDTILKVAAEKWTEAIEREQYNTSTHDLGFMLYCSYGNGYRLTNDPTYKRVLLTGAASLATRFDPKVGLIKSWDKMGEYNYPVIIDNMMNLEFLFWAAKASGNKKLSEIAIAHADNTLKNHFRPDASSYHVVCYDSVGNVIARKTNQGYADGSAWARGQAWGLYGYTVMYRETRNKRYLDQARAIAKFFMEHPRLPKDKIPYWDFDDPTIPDAPRDASAAAIASSALLELSRYVDVVTSEKYYHFAEKVLVCLSGPAYFTSSGNNHFLLKHSTGNMPKKSEIDVPLIYADYYYIEALLRYQKFKTLS
ncbi:glycoside hydrolase family 88 protein [Niabella ginsenosidivorans]|nr:glycoside hydrolase family 88 protein [Niabella ginsenosidivorans]